MLRIIVEENKKYSEEENNKALLKMKILLEAMRFLQGKSLPKGPTIELDFRPIPKDMVNPGNFTYKKKVA